MSLLSLIKPITVGDRFFEDKDAWVVGKYGLEFLNEIFEIEKNELK
jgi:hypothetical protein